MRKVLLLEEREDFEPLNVVLCKKDLVECREWSNDWDSGYECDECKLSDYLGKLKTVGAIKRVSYVTTYEKGFLLPRDASSPTGTSALTG